MAYFITDKCIGCAVCTKVCPVGAISGLRNKQHRVIPELCFDCGACGRICPHAAVLDADKNVCKRIRPLYGRSQKTDNCGGGRVVLRTRKAGLFLPPRHARKPQTTRRKLKRPGRMTQVKHSHRRSRSLPKTSAAMLDPHCSRTKR